MRPGSRQVKQFVAKERGLPFTQDVPVEFLPDAEFRQLLDELNAEAKAEAEPDEAANFDKFYRALHLVGEGESAEQLFEKAYDEGIIGVYLPEKDRMVVRGDDLDLYATSTLVHELVHALDDQHFDLDRPEYDDRVDDEVSFGFTSLVEGNAVRIQEAWEAQLSDDEKEQLKKEESEYAEGVDLDGIPESVLAVAGLPYELGPLFVDTLLRDGGQPTVDAAFADPPVTSEQVVFGDLYLDGEAAAPVADPGAVAEAVGTGRLRARRVPRRAVRRRDRARRRRVPLGWRPLRRLRRPGHGEPVRRHLRHRRQRRRHRRVRGLPGRVGRAARQRHGEPRRRPREPGGLRVTETGPQAGTEERCFYHRDRVTGRRCTRCGRPACPDCLRQAPVGSQCFQCMRQAAPPRRERVRRQVATSGPIVTQVLIAVNLTVFVLAIFAGGQLTRGGGDAFRDFGLFGPAVDVNGEWYRVITGGFLHDGLIHIGFNMYMLYVLGNMLERGIGSLRFTTLYMTSLVGGSLGALLVEPRALTVGASGAVFGLMGAAFVIIRQRGGDPFAGGLAMIIGINLVLTFTVSSISIGGHIGGLVTGALVGYVTELRPGGSPMSSRLASAVTAGIGLVLFGAAVWAAGTWVDPIF